MQRSLCAIAFSAAALLSASVHAAFVDFNTPGQLASDFTIVNNGGALTQEASGGVGGSGSILISNDSTATYKVAPFSWSSQPLEVSIMVRKVDATATSRVAVVGLVGSDNMGFFNAGTNSFISARLDTVQSSPTDLANLNIQARGLGTLNTGANLLGSNITLTNDNWYRLTAAFTKLATANSFDISVKVEDFGTDGLTALGTVVSLNTTYTNASAGEIWGDGSVFAAVRGTLVGGGPRLDNFSAVVVPEPGTALLLLPLSAMLIRRR